VFCFFDSHTKKDSAMLKINVLSLVSIALFAGSLLTSAAQAQTMTPAKPAPKPAVAKPAAKPATSSSAAKVAAPAAAGAVAAAAAALTPGQLDAAQRVMVGTAKCEFSEEVQVAADSSKPGHFLLRHKQQQFNMVPVETTTGAVRLEDKRQGVMWLQIPSKSMLMNTRIGQRMIDDCVIS
jgi:hypothetical protein